MVIEATTIQPTAAENVRGGHGTVLGHALVGHIESSKILGIAMNRLEPGGAIGKHSHSGEEEFYFCISGQGVVTDSDGEFPFTPGVLQLTRDGGIQGLRNTGTTELVFLAGLISH